MHYIFLIYFGTTKIFMGLGVCNRYGAYHLLTKKCHQSWEDCY